MGMIPEVKCRRCGESFSSMRSRCPNCGTRRVTQSSRTPGNTPGTVKGTVSYERAETNTKWQMIFGLILVVAVILAVIVMVSTTLNGVDGQTPGRATVPLPTDDAMPTPDSAPTPSPTPTPTIEKVSIMYLGLSELGDVNTNPNAFSPTMHVGDEHLHLNVSVYPATVAVAANQIHWSSSEPDVIQVTVNPEDGSCDVSCVGTINGGVVITAEIFGKEGTCRIYARD